jgi:hypothetical protein
LDPDDNKHGLVVALKDQSSAIRWSKGTNIQTNATDTAIGTGASNTTQIISEQGATEISYAAGLARAYRGGGYEDWFLPSQYEMVELFDKKYIVESLAEVDAFSTANYYWTSTEKSTSHASMCFSGGLGGAGSREKLSGIGKVRAVRSF